MQGRDDPVTQIFTLDAATSREHMGSRQAMDQARIVIGKPLPFSIFTADGKLLLAQGRVVESERLRDMLLRNGHHSDESGDADATGSLDSTRIRKAREQADREQEIAERDSPLEKLFRDYDASSAGHHLSISIARSDTDKAFPVQLMGVHGQSVIVTAPVHPDGSLVPVLNGQTWLCRTFQMTSAFRFSAMASKVAFEPFPHLYLKLKKEVEHRRVRGAPRARVAVRAELHAPDATPCLISDLSTSGARIGVDATRTLTPGQQGRLIVSLNVLQSKYELALDTVVLNPIGPSDSRHPEIAFYGIKFSRPDEKDALVLHGFVGEHLLSEFHSLWQMLTMASGFDT